jgi:hypothetical protein
VVQIAATASWASRDRGEGVRCIVMVAPWLGERSGVGTCSSLAPFLVRYGVREDRTARRPPRRSSARLCEKPEPRQSFARMLAIQYSDLRPESEAPAGDLQVTWTPPDPCVGGWRPSSRRLLQTCFGRSVLEAIAGRRNSARQDREQRGTDCPDQAVARTESPGVAAGRRAPGVGVLAKVSELASGFRGRRHAPGRQLSGWARFVGPRRVRWPYGNYNRRHRTQETPP